MKPCDFLGTLLLARGIVHSAHLSTRSFAKHSALAGFYSGIIGLADTFAEAYQGRHGLIGPVTLLSPKKTANIVEFLTAQGAELEAARYEVCDKSDTPLQNIIDEVIGLYLSTLYKLKFLA